MSNEARCLHCRERISGREKCGACGLRLARQCPECHAELLHGCVPQVHVQVCGGGRAVRDDGDGGWPTETGPR
jgi:hypothetical protein